MATLLPPPKRQKVYHGVPEPEKPDPAPVPNVLVQFVLPDDEMDVDGQVKKGEKGMEVVSIPADLSRAGLEVLVNKLKAQLRKPDDEDDGPTPFSFHISSSETRIPIISSILLDILESKYGESQGGNLGQEDIFQVHCTPQAIFRVRPATRCVGSIKAHTAPILTLSLSPSGTRLVSGGGDCTARVYDIETGTLTQSLSGHSGWVLCAEWEPLERCIATGGHDGIVRLWDPKSGNPFGTLPTTKKDKDKDVSAPAPPPPAKPSKDTGALKGHSKWISSLAWEPLCVSPYPRLASSSKDATVRIWSALSTVEGGTVGSKKCEIVLAGHKGSVNVVKWGAGPIIDKKACGVIYTASSDCTLKMWDGTNGALLRTLSSHAHWVTTLSLSTDYILRTGPFDPVKPFSKSGTSSDAHALALKRITSCGKEMLVSGSDDHTLFLWDPVPAPGEKAGTIKPLNRLTGHQNTVSHTAFSPDGRLIASASFDSSIRLWSASAGTFVATLRGHLGAVYRISFSPDSRWLGSVGKDGVVRVWDVQRQKLKESLIGNVFGSAKASKGANTTHTDEVWCVDWIADKVVSAGRDGSVRVWGN